MAHNFIEILCKILQKNKIFSAQEAQDLVKNFKGQSQESFDEFLISQNLVSKEELLKALSEYYEVPSFDVVGYLFDKQLINEFDFEVLMRHAAIPVERDENMLFIVTSNPNNQDLLQELSEFVSDEIEFFVGIKLDIQDILAEYSEESPFHTADDEIDSRDELYEDEQLLEDVFKEK